tara:strand:+ start:618 stop:842 length:225 start_codon:yes stop_codon:yes gene_type:complete
MIIKNRESNNFTVAFKKKISSYSPKIKKNKAPTKKAKTSLLPKKRYSLKKISNKTVIIVIINTKTPPNKGTGFL